MYIPDHALIPVLPVVGHSQESKAGIMKLLISMVYFVGRMLIFPC